MKKLFSVYDSKTEAYGVPFAMITKGEALRGFADVANDPQTQICKYPGDFTLFELGEFNELNGMFNIYETKINLGTAIEFKKENPV